MVIIAVFFSIGSAVISGLFSLGYEYGSAFFVFHNLCYLHSPCKGAILFYYCLMNFAVREPVVVVISNR